MSKPIDTSLEAKTGRPEELRAIGASWEKFAGHPPEAPTRQFRSVYTVARHDPTEVEGVYREVIERVSIEEVQAAA